MDNAQQLAQLLAQGQQGQQGQPGQQPGQNPLEWLKSFIRPNTPPGALSNQDPYSAYVLEALDRGENPMQRMEFLSKMGANNGI